VGEKNKRHNRQKEAAFFFFPGTGVLLLAGTGLDSMGTGLGFPHYLLSLVTASFLFLSRKVDPS
jgi:hypothetical protein